jgi:hypothetical protein
MWLLHALGLADRDISEHLLQVMATRKLESPINGVGIQVGGIMSPLLPRASTRVTVLPHHHAEEMRIRRMQTRMLSVLTVADTFLGVGKWLIKPLHPYPTFVLAKDLSHQRVAALFETWTPLTSQAIM